MQSTGHSSMQALSLRSTQGWAMTYVTVRSSSCGRRVAAGLRLARAHQVRRLVSRTAGRSPTGRVLVSSRVSPRLGPDLVGQRVVVRRRLGGGRVGDLLGELLAWDSDGDGQVRVRTRHGEVQVPISEVVAGKAVPPPPTRRGAPHRALTWEQLEDVAADGWRPLEQDWLGARGQGWRLRAAAGFTGRANSVLPLGDPGQPLPDAVDAVEA